MEFKEAMKIFGKHTGMGAHTHLIVLSVKSGKARVKQFNVSRSGSHWQEALYVSSDYSGEVALKDISNSGKHYCVLYVFEGGEAKETLKPETGYWNKPCPVCRRIREVVEQWS